MTTPAFGTAAPAYRNLDANGVDLATGDHVTSLTEGTIGSGEGALSLVRNGVWTSGVNGHDWDLIWLDQYAGNVFANFNQRSENFISGASALANGSTLTLSGSDYILQRADGTTIDFQLQDPNCTPSGGSSCRWNPVSITSPDGKSVSLTWEQWLICPDVPIEEQVCTVDSVRLSQVANSYGYSIGFTYASPGNNSGGPSGPAVDWFKRTRADFYNSAAGGSSQANVTYSYPSAGVTQVTDMGGGCGGSPAPSTWSAASAGPARAATRPRSRDRAAWSPRSRGTASPPIIREASRARPRR